MALICSFVSNDRGVVVVVVVVVLSVVGVVNTAGDVGGVFSTALSAFVEVEGGGGG